MDQSRVYTKTSKGILEGNMKMRSLTREHGRLLALIDGKSTVGDLLARHARLSEGRLASMLDDLAQAGMIRLLNSGLTIDDLGFSSTIIVDEANTQAFFEAQAELERELRRKQQESETAQEADRLSLLQEVSADIAAEAEQLKREEAMRSAEAEGRRQESVTKEQAEAEQTRAEATKRKQETEQQQIQEEAARKVREKAEGEAKALADKQAKEAERNRLAAERQAEKEAQLQARQEREAAKRVQRELEAKIQAAEEEAQRRAEMENRIREMEKAKQQAETESQALTRALEETRLAAELEARVKRRMEARAREEESARQRVEQEAQAKIEVERKAREAAEARAQAEAEARKQAEESARRQTEAARLQAEQEAQAKIEVERKAREAAEARAQAEADAKYQAEAAHLQAEQVAQHKLESERQAREAAEARACAEAEARQQAEAEIKRQAEAARLKAEQEATARLEAERQAQEAEAARMEAARLAREEAEREAQAAERMAQEEAVRIARVEDEARQRAEEEAQRREAERRAREEAEARAVAEAEEAIRLEAEAVKRELEAQQRAEEARQAREAEERAAEAARLAEAEAERKTRLEAEAREREAEELALREAQVRAEAEAAIRAAQEDARREREEEDRMRQEAEVRARAAAEQQEQLFPFLAKQRKQTFKLDRRLIKPLSIGVGGLLLMLLALVHLIPFNFHIPHLERRLSESIGQRVSIQEVRVALYPAPHWRFVEVRIGDLNAVRIGEADLYPTLGSWFSEQMQARSVELHTVYLPEASVMALPVWAKHQRIAQIPVSLQHVVVKNAKLENRLLDLFAFDADLALQGGRVNQAWIQSTDKRISMQLKPEASGGVAVQFDAAQFLLPMEPRIQFDVLKLEGLATVQGMKVSKVEGQLYGGSMSGTAQVGWNKAWTFTTDLDLRHVAIDSALPLFTRQIQLSGSLEAKVRLAAQSSDQKRLFASPHVQATFRAKDGLIGGVDLARAIQVPQRDGLIGGKTHFNEFSGYLQLQNGVYHYRQLKLKMGLLTGAGNIAINPDQDLNGQVSGEVHSRAAAMRRNFIVGGSLATPTLKSAGAAQRLLSVESVDANP